MDFILFLVFAGIMFYFNQIKPRQQQKTISQQQAVIPHTQAQLIQNAHVTHIKSDISRARPHIPPLFGIEITPAQQRRLGKNDPSVLAAQRSKQLHQTQQVRSSFFEQMTSQVEHVFKQVNETAKHQSAASRRQQNSALNKMFDHLFSK